MRTFLLSLLPLICLITSKSTEPTQGNASFVPPGSVQIRDSLYADEAEITNLHYQEYQYWVKRIFGSTSEEYQKTRLDTTVWIQVENLEKLAETYHVDVKYAHYPVIGITLAQAKSYTEWRTERVMEKILIDSEIMAFDYNQNVHNYFTFEKFLNGDYIYIEGNVQLTQKPVEIDFVKFKIPNAHEWELISGMSEEIMNSLESLTVNVKSHKKNQCPFNTSEFHSSKKNKSKLLKHASGMKMATSPSKSFEQNKFGMYGVVGNVSELIDEVGRSKGENWTSSALHFSIEKVNGYNEPNCWTGFRNICYVSKLNLRSGN